MKDMLKSVVDHVEEHDRRIRNLEDALKVLKHSNDTFQGMINKMISQKKLKEYSSSMEYEGHTRG